MNNILITGANGQLGNEIKEISKTYNQFNFIFVDINDFDISNDKQVNSFLDKKDISIIINCAAYTNVDKAENDAENAFNINALGAENLKNFAEKSDIPFIHISTDYVFEGKNFKPYTETDQTNPQGIYGKTKLQGEQRILSYSKSLIIRTSWLYSSFGNNFVKTIIKLAKENDEISIVFDQVGSPTYAGDLALSILKITEKLLNKEIEHYGIFHYSNEGVCSWYDFTVSIINQLKLKTKIKAVKSEQFPRPAPRPFFSVLDKSKIKEIYNIEIPHWQISLKKCLEQF